MCSSTANAYNDSIPTIKDFTIEKNIAKAKLTIAPTIATKILKRHLAVLNQSEHHHENTLRKDIGSSVAR